MNFSPLIIGTAIVVIAAALRWLFIRQSSALKVDHYYWLLAAKAFRTQHKQPVRFDGRYLLEPPEQAYPPFFGWLLSKFPDKLLSGNKAVLLSQAADAMTLGISVAFALWLGLGAWAILAMMLIALLAPTLVAYNTQLNPRSFGNLFLVLKLTCEVLAVASVGTEALVLWTIAALATAAVMLTHKMTTQLMLALWPAWAVALSSPIAATIPVLGLVCAGMVIGPGALLYQCAAHIDIVRFWTRHWCHLGVHGIHTSPIYGKPGTAADGFHKAGWRGQFQHARLIFGYAPALILMPATLLVGAPWPPAWLIVWTVGTLAWALATSLVGVLRGLGAGPLYVFFAVIPSSLWLGYGIDGGDVRSVAVLVAATLFSAYALTSGWRQRHVRRLIQEDGHSQLLQRLRQLPATRVAVFPLNAVEAVVGETPHTVLWGAHGYGFELLEPIFPRITRKLSATFAQYRIARIVWNDDWWPEAEATLRAEADLGEIERFGTWRTAQISTSAAAPKPRVGVLGTLHNFPREGLEADLHPLSVHADGKGLFGAISLYRTLRLGRYDIFESAKPGAWPLLVATFAGVPHRIGPMPQSWVERVLADASLWKVRLDGSGAYQKHADIYGALHQGDHDFISQYKI